LFVGLRQRRFYPVIDEMTAEKREPVHPFGMHRVPVSYGGFIQVFRTFPDIVASRSGEYEYSGIFCNSCTTGFLFCLMPFASS